MPVCNIRNTISHRAPITCQVSDSEKTHILHQASRVGSFIRKNFFFPFNPQKRAKEELSSAQQFWETSRPDLEYPKKEAIRKHFDRYEQSIEFEGGIKLKCIVFESKGCQKKGVKVLNHLILQGNTSTLDNNWEGAYPFFHSYMEHKEKDKNLPPARFIMWNQYDNKIVKPGTTKEEMYLPGSMDEWTFLTKKLIESFTHKYGKFQLMAAHSLGTIPMVGQLKHWTEKEFKDFFPGTVFLAKGPSSLYEASKNVPFEFGCYPFGWVFILGAIMYFLAKATGWTLELDQTLVDFFNKLPQTADIKKKLNNTNLIISEVKHDYYFPKKASLAASEKLDQIKGSNLYRVSFNPPLNRSTRKGQHSYNPRLLQRSYVYQEKLHSNGVRVVHHKNEKEVTENKKDHHMLLKEGKSLIDVVLESAWRGSLTGRDLKRRVSRLNVAA